jgi:hypothetical protein
MPNMPNTEASFAELKARLAKTIDYCKTFKPAQIDGTEDKDITIKPGANERKFTGQGLLQNFILPNFYFHCSRGDDLAALGPGNDVAYDSNFGNAALEKPNQGPAGMPTPRKVEFGLGGRVPR